MVLGSARSHQGRSASFLIQAYLYVFFSKSCCQTKCASNKKLIQDYSARSPCYFIALLLFQHVLTCLGVRCSQHVKFLLQDKDHLDLLWEAALSVTVQVRFCSGLQENSLARNLQSEAVKALGHASLSDSFAVFSRLVKELQTEKVQDGVALGLAYNGTVYNAAIHKAALVLGGILDQTGQPVENALSRLELQFGRDILSSGYSKLSKMIAYGRSVGTTWSTIHGPRSAPEIVSWMIEMLILAFKTKMRLPSKATESWLDKDRKTGVAGFWQVTGVILQAGCLEAWAG